jgi:transglutaminase-like putative cysteine protease
VTAVDWTRVERVTLDLHQRYWYTYTAPVTDMHQRLIMIPPDEHLQQRLLSFELDVRGAEGGYHTGWETDAFGNRVCHIDAPRVEHMVEFDARYSVERWAARETTANGEGWEVYCAATALTAADDRLRAVAHAIAEATRDPRERAEKAHKWAAGAIVFQVGVTGVRTPAAMALHLGRGVCQDYAHLLLCVLRQLGIPARYVSGQLLGEGVPHAWVEALIEREVLAYDPTHHRRARLDYVTVAVGRDFADVTPTSGVFSGAAIGVLSAAKSARVRTVGPRSAGAADGAAA